MKLFSIMLEGREGSNGFFVVVTTAARTMKRGEELALEEADRRAWRITCVEEVTCLGEAPEEEGILEVSGRSFFPCSQDRAPFIG
jgi:hypothetical protein